MADVNIILLSIIVLQLAFVAAVAISPRALEAIADSLRRQAHAMRCFYRARREWTKEEAL